MAPSQWPKFDPARYKWLTRNSLCVFAKLSAYAVCRLSLSQWFGFIETVDIILKKFDGLMEKFDSQPR